jgi:capsule biosynthesis phosphatase
MEKSTFIIDVDGTISHAQKLSDGSFDYENAEPVQPVIEQINRLYQEGHTIFLSTARGMRTYAGDLQQINAKVRPVLEAWLKRHGVLYHELWMGKAWGPNPVYIDDRGISINSFVNAGPENHFEIIQENNKL